ncbi:MAG: DUF935 domain-containing protein [Rhodospirillum sp.]|nr:DUF935 domain-containing protein [Rhodospirillum sp.]MCF8491368.1 DUF935 domain-containing protein [Rhodospirillum sp.]MCF8500192.1 DUF935 domain-containing protein [Rhodospirillum sp.]
MALLGPDGQPIKRKDLEREIATPTIGGVLSPWSEFSVTKTTPRRLSTLLRSVEQGGDPSAYLALAAEIEERDLHYAGVLGVRKRQVSQLPITVEAASDDKADQIAADLAREWLDRDELEDDLFDILDALGKGVSYTEMIWEPQGDRLWPRLEWRDPKWFRFDRIDGRTPLLIDESGAEVPFPPFKFINHRGRFLSGLPIKGGLARGACWSWIFKTFDIQAWMVLAEVYGHPVRLGKYHEGATEEQKRTLMKAVRSIAQDAAAIIPSSMVIDFIDAKVSTNGEMFERMANYMDMQTSKLVLGQVGTTDAVAGGYAVGKVHDGVRGDIERADAKGLAGTLNRDAVRPLIDVNLGPRDRYPRLKIGRDEEFDREKEAKILQALVPMGLKVTMSEARDRFGYQDPDEGEDLLSAPPAAQQSGAHPEAPPIDATTRTAGLTPAAASNPAPDLIGDLAERESEERWEEVMTPVRDEIQALLEDCTTPEEFLARLPELAGRLPMEGLTESLARCAFAARLEGEADGA